MYVLSKDPLPFWTSTYWKMCLLDMCWGTAILTASDCFWGQALSDLQRWKLKGPREEVEEPGPKGQGYPLEPQPWWPMQRQLEPPGDIARRQTGGKNEPWLLLPPALTASQWLNSGGAWKHSPQDQRPAGEDRDGTEGKRTNALTMCVCQTLFSPLTPNHWLLGGRQCYYLIRTKRNWEGYVTCPRTHKW